MFNIAIRPILVDESLLLGGGSGLLLGGSLEASEDWLGRSRLELLSILNTGPVVLGLSHLVAQGDRLFPRLSELGSTVQVKLGEIFELSSLLDVAAANNRWARAFA